MREEKYLESVQRDILRSKKWKRFVRRLDIGKEERVNIKALPVRFVWYLPGNGKTTYHSIMACYKDEIVVSDMVYGTMSLNMIRHALTHELAHLYLMVNDVPYHDQALLFHKALEYLKIDLEVDLTTRYRRKTGKDRRWKS